MGIWRDRGTWRRKEGGHGNTGDMRDMEGDMRGHGGDVGSGQWEQEEDTWGTLGDSPIFTSSTSTFRSKLSHLFSFSGTLAL